MALETPSSPPPPAKQRSFFFNSSANTDTEKRRPSLKFPAGWSGAFRRGSTASASESEKEKTPLFTPSSIFRGIPVAEPENGTLTPGSGSVSTQPATRGSGSVSTQPAGPGKKRSIGSSAVMDEFGSVTIDPTRTFNKLYQVPGSGRAKMKGSQVTFVSSSSRNLISERSKSIQGRIYHVLSTKLGIETQQPLAAKSISRHPNHHPTFPLYSLRCHREFLIASSLCHPNVIKTHDMVFDDRRGRYLVIMDYVDGGSLNDLVKLDREKCVARRVEMWKEAVEGVAHLVSATDELDLANDLTRSREQHERGFVHRDIKPHNFVLDGRTVKLIDFGTAICSGRGHPGGVDCDLCGVSDFTESFETCQGIVGTKQFMAPEIFGGARS